VAKKHDNQHTVVVRDSDNQIATLDELGVSRQRLSEWRETRDALYLGDRVVGDGGGLGDLGACVDRRFRRFLRNRSARFSLLRLSLLRDQRQPAA
jgi:hypothetical protein